jgi:AcrR family transcriptional regulator
MAADTPSTPRPPGAARARNPRAGTLDRREAVLRAAMSVFGQRGYNKGGLIEVAEQAGMTHAGVLHHFGSKEALLVAMLQYRDGEEAAGVPGRAQTEGPAFLGHILDTVTENTTRPGVVQTYTVLSAESVTEGHPAQDYFRDRITVLRDKIAHVLAEVTGRDAHEDDVRDDASALIALMDGLQVQWLLDPDAVDMPRIVAKAMDELVDRLRTRTPAPAFPRSPAESVQDSGSSSSESSSSESSSSESSSPESSSSESSSSESSSSESSSSGSSSSPASSDSSSMSTPSTSPE